MSKFKKTVMAFSGLALFYACTMRLVDPSAAVFLQTHLASTGNVLTTELASEIRGLGAAMLLAGIVAFLGVFRSRASVTSFVVVSVIFAGVVVGRAVSLVFDGIPDADLFRPAIVEGILAALNLFCLAHSLIKEREASGTSVHNAVR